MSEWFESFPCNVFFGTGKRKVFIFAALRNETAGFIKLSLLVKANHII